MVLIRAELAGLLERTGRRARFFARARLGDRVVESLVVKRSPSPRWHARFVFGLEQSAIEQLHKASGEVLHVSVFHQHTLGRTEIPVTNVPCPVSLTEYALNDDDGSAGLSLCDDRTTRGNSMREFEPSDNPANFKLDRIQPVV